MATTTQFYKSILVSVIRTQACSSTAEVHMLGDKLGKSTIALYCCDYCAKPKMHECVSFYSFRVLVLTESIFSLLFPFYKVDFLFFFYAVLVVSLTAFSNCFKCVVCNFDTCFKTIFVSVTNYLLTD